MRAAVLFAFAAVLVLACMSSLTVADDVCRCECCNGAACNDGFNSTFGIPDCDQCTPNRCKVRVDQCEHSPHIFARCVNRDSWWSKASVYTWLFIVSTLIILGFFKDRVEFLKTRLRTA